MIYSECFASQPSSFWASVSDRGQRLVCQTVNPVNRPADLTEGEKTRKGPKYPQFTKQCPKIGILNMTILYLLVEYPSRSHHSY